MKLSEARSESAGCRGHDGDFVRIFARRLAAPPAARPGTSRRVETAVGKGASTPEKIVRRLVDKGWITPFQGEVLLGGKAAGLVFGPYVLLSRLGEGGMGAVFKARHVRLGRIDALKVIRADKSSSKLVAKRFQREIQLTADLNHPHLIKRWMPGRSATNSTWQPSTFLAKT